MTKDCSFGLFLHRTVRSDEECLALITSLGISTLQSLTVDSVDARGLFPILAGKGFVQTIEFIINETLVKAAEEHGSYNLELITPIYWEWGVQAACTAADCLQFEVLQKLVFQWQCPFDMYVMRSVILHSDDWPFIQSMLDRFRSLHTIFDDTSDWSKLAATACFRGNIQALTYIVSNFHGKLPVSKFLCQAIEGKQVEMVVFVLETYCKFTSSTSLCKMLEEACILSCAFGSVPLVSYLYDKWTALLPKNGESIPSCVSSIYRNMILFMAMYENTAVLSWCLELPLSPFPVSAELISSLMHNPKRLYVNTDILSILKNRLHPKEVNAEILALLFTHVFFRRLSYYWKYWLFEGENTMLSTRDLTQQKYLQHRMSCMLMSSAEILGLSLEEHGEPDYQFMKDMMMLPECRSIFPATHMPTVLVHAVENHAPTSYVSLLLNQMDDYLSNREMECDELKSEWTKSVQRGIHISLHVSGRQLNTWLALHRYLFQQTNK